MTGNFNLQLVQCKTNELEKWVIWKRNIGKTYFSSIISFKESNVIAEINIPQIYGRKFTLNPIDTLARDESQKQEETRRGSSRILTSDLLRKFTVPEYLLLSQYLRRYGYIYNKQKDEFIKKFDINNGNKNGL